MSDEISKWAGITASLIAICGVVYMAGITYSEFQSLSDEVSELKKQNVAYEKALTKHFGENWLSRVDHIEGTSSLKSDFEYKTTELTTAVESNLKQVSEVNQWISSFRYWAQQQDVLVRKETLDRFRATAVYSSSSSLETFNIKINKQHEKGHLYKVGDSVLIENPKPPGESVKVSVIGFTNDTENPEVLVQMNTSLLSELGLSKWDGRYELFITNDLQVLRWQSLENIHIESQLRKKVFKSDS
ncbi:hypothetical protein [Vibrio rhodolitus]|uniref:hypothetical protein n=1 Tax=Vibrio rhodolitus TaxID=2231649 RepID=UPI000E09EF01|nr:hypothetical protein [Vibrio rhodolitus]